MKKLLYPLLAGTVLVIAACSAKKSEDKLAGLGINLQNIDTSVRPQDDFFKYVNGGWISKATIPPDQGRWGSFNELREFNNEAVLAGFKKSRRKYREIS